MTLDDWKILKNGSENSLLESTKKFKSYRLWKDWIIEVHHIKNDNGYRYLLKKNNLNAKVLKKQFEYKHCTNCDCLIKIKNNTDSKYNRNDYYCDGCIKNIYKKNYISRKNKGKLPTLEQQNESLRLGLIEFKKSSTYKKLVSFVKKEGPFKSNIELVKIFYEENKGCKKYVIEEAVSRIREKYKIKKLTKIERMTDEERKLYYRKQRKKYLQQNPENCRRLNRKAQKERRKNPLNKIVSNLRTRVNLVIRTQKFPKTKHLKEVLGCEWSVFKEWLESNFKKGMTFKNYGKVWSLQHIVALNHVENEEDIYLLNYYKNLKPMYVKKNSSLNDKLLWDDINDWHLNNKRICEIIDTLVENDKIVQNDYKNYLDKIFNIPIFQVKDKKFLMNNWRWEVHSNNIKKEETKKIMKEIFTDDIIKKLKDTHNGIEKRM